MSRPIIMSAESVRAILAGRKKTQTRRVLTSRQHSAASINEDVAFHPTADGRSWVGWYPTDPGPEETARLYPTGGIVCPYGAPGDRLVVRERHRFWSQAASPADPRVLVQYRADMAERWCDAEPKPAHTADEGGAFARWRSPIHMPRWASRLTLQVTGVRVERLQAITERDARAEGVPTNALGQYVPPYASSAGWTQARDAFPSWWDAINGKRPGCLWADDPWLWVLSFRRLP